MADFLYTTVPGKIRPLLLKIKDVGVPDSVSQAWLKSIGFPSSNDRSLLNVLRAGGLVDDGKKPTPSWTKFRGSSGPKVLAEGIRENYKDLYKVYGNAHDRSNTELESVISTTTKAGKQTISKTVATFKALAAEADFNGVMNAEVDEVVEEEAGPMHAPVSTGPAKAGPARPNSAGPSLHIDMQVHISADSTPEQIDQIFASMAKHLYGVKG